MSAQSSRKNVQEFLDKLEEIRAVFVLGQRSLPFLEDVMQFVEDVTVLLEEVDVTIQNRTGHMQKATDQLQSVSEATEVATDEILDYTDEVLSKLDVLKSGMEASKDQFQEVASADEQLLALLREELGAEHQDLLERVEEIEAKKRTLRNDWMEQVEDSQEALSSIRRKMNQITMSLQVQDITEQQLESVDHLIGTVRQRISALLQDLGSGEVAQKDMPSGEPSSTATFNQGARYDHSPERQQRADETVANMNDGSAPTGSSSSSNGSSASEPVSGESPASGQAAASQSDIDEMFGSQDTSSTEDDAGTDDEGGGEMASQEDIDELFQ